MNYWSNLTKGLEPYVPGEQPQDRKYIKLNTNENPYPPSPKVLEAIKESKLKNLRLYPDPESSDLKEKLSEYYNIEKKQIFIGNGSDEVLAFSFMAFFNPGQTILFPQITYSFYPVYCNLFRIDYQTISMNQDFSIDLLGFNKNNGGVIIPNPNAPTGICLTLKEIKKILNYNKETVVIIDEAYIDFGGESAISLIDDYPNLLVVQTLSKSRALAGMRIGFAFGNESLIEGLTRVKNSFNSYTIDRLAQIAAIKSLDDQGYFLSIKEKVIKTRQSTAEKLKKLGFVVLPSKSNFLFITHPDNFAADIFKWLKKEGILVRYFKEKGIDNYLRVSIGTKNEMAVFLEKIEQYLRSDK